MRAIEKYRDRCHKWLRGNSFIAHLRTERGNDVSTGEFELNYNTGDPPIFKNKSDLIKDQTVWVCTDPKDSNLMVGDILRSINPTSSKVELIPTDSDPVEQGKATALINALKETNKVNVDRDNIAGKDWYYIRSVRRKKVRISKIEWDELDTKLKCELCSGKKINKYRRKIQCREKDRSTDDIEQQFKDFELVFAEHNEGIQYLP